MARNRVTIYDIAREAGVSPATVSRILKGSSVVSEEKADRVSKLIRKYNFHPSAVARALSETRTKMIGHGHGRYRKSILQQRIFRML